MTYNLHKISISNSYICMCVYKFCVLVKPLNKHHRSDILKINFVGIILIMCFLFISH